MICVSVYVGGYGYGEGCGCVGVEDVAGKGGANGRVNVLFRRG